MSKSNWRFKSSRIDPVNGEIELTYLDEEGNPKVLLTHKDMAEHIFTHITGDMALDARKRIDTLVKG